MPQDIYTRLTLGENISVQQGCWWEQDWTESGELEVYPNSAYLPRVTQISKVEPHIRIDLHE